MLKKLVDGLVFGAGFGISLALVWFIATSVLLPHAASSHKGPPPSSIARIGEDDSREVEPPEALFHELPIEEQIKAASVIALASYEPGDDGRMKAVLKEFLKKDPDVTFYYDLGDEYRSSSYYPKPGTSYGDGVVIFFEGSRR